MPITDGIGHSEYTRQKHDNLAGILKMHLDICRGIDQRNALRCWWYFDMNAGDGRGSPAVAWSVLNTCQPPFSWQFVFSEHHYPSYCALGDRFDGFPGVACHYEDNRAVASHYHNQITRLDYGVVFHDPNGGEIDLDMLRNFRDSRLDVVIYYSAAGNKRLDTAFQGRRGVRLGRIVAEDVKQHWLIRLPEGKHQWTMLIGSNWVDFPAWERRGFYKLRSEAGQNIYDRLNSTARERTQRNERLEGFNSPPYRTYAEYLKHPTFLAVRAQVMQRAGGICEVCHTARATQVHHLKYPKWGTFDVPENMVAICYPCHCTAHGKPQ